MKTRAWCLLPALLVLAVQTHAEDLEDYFVKAQQQANKTVLRNLRLFDPYTGTITEPQDVLIENGLVKEVLGAGSGTPAPVNIDCDGQFGVAGMFDCHTHLAHLTNQSPDSLRAALEAFVRSGVMEVRDVGGPLDRISALSRQCARNELIGPEIFYAGPMLEASPLMWAKVNEILPGFTVPIDTDAQVDSIVAALKAQGACMVKTFNHIDPAVYRHVVEAAHRAGLKIVHDPGTPLFHWMPIDKALDLGVTSFEHAKAPWPVVLKDDLRAQQDAATGPDVAPLAQMAVMMQAAERRMEAVSLARLDSLADRMAAQNAVLCPTLYVFHEFVEALKPDSSAAPADSQPAGPEAMKRKVITAMDDVSRAFVREMAAHHVKMLVGQDGCTPGATLEEMQLLRDCGVPDVEILRGATLYPAEWLGVSDRYGSITPGRVANIVVVKADPTAHCGNMDTILFAMRKGVILSSGKPGPAVLGTR